MSASSNRPKNISFRPSPVALFRSSQGEGAETYRVHLSDGSTLAIDRKGSQWSPGQAPPETPEGFRLLPPARLPPWAAAELRSHLGTRPPENDAGELVRLLAVLRSAFGAILGHFRIPREDAQDLVQEALVAALRRSGEIRCPEAFLRVTLRNRCILYWRRRRRDGALFVPLGEAHDGPGHDTTGALDAGLDTERILAALRPPQRRVLQATVLEGRGSREAAAHLGAVSRPAVAKARLRALRAAHRWACHPTKKRGRGKEETGRGREVTSREGERASSPDGKK